MRLPDIDEGRVRDDLDCGVEVDREDAGGLLVHFLWLGERYRDEGGLASAGHADHDEADRVVVVFVVRGLLRLLLLLHFVWLVNWLL